MGTRHITIVRDEQGRKIIEMYGQFDGYPEGHGEDLKQFLDSGTLVNGIGQDRRVFNGLGCLAAQLVAQFKTQAGGFYLYAPTEETNNMHDYYDKYFAEYVYEIDHNLNLKCWDAYENRLEFEHFRDKEKFADTEYWNG